MSPLTRVVCNKLQQLSSRLCKGSDLKKSTIKWYERHFVLAHVAVFPGKDKSWECINSFDGWINNTFSVRINFMLYVTSIMFLEKFVHIFYLLTGLLVYLHTNIGVRVSWDGSHFAEIAVDDIWKGQTCGLCGNYNGDASDDFM